MSRKDKGASTADPPKGLFRRARDAFFRIRTRLLLVNAVVLLVPAAGLEFARIYERQLLDALERDMRDQAILTRAVLEEDLAQGVPLAAPRHEAVLMRAAEGTRMRVRVVDPEGVVLVDSHRQGAPEGPEPEGPDYFSGAAQTASTLVSAGSGREGRARREIRFWAWPELEARTEIRTALAGRAATYTRIRANPPAVFLFLAEPIRHEGAVRGAVYVVRSTQPVLVELYRIRAGLMKVLAVALLITALITIALAWSISRPLSHLAKAAHRIASGERDVPVPVEGSGEVRELGEAFAAMTTRLEERMRYASEFAADVAHEFKSPLTSIRGAAELLEEGAADDLEARRRFLQNIELDVARLDRLVTRLLELGRIEASATSAMPIDLAALLSRVAARCATDDVQVALSIPAGPSFLNARGADLETAVVNLVDNAVRFSPQGASVVLELQRVSHAFQIIVRDRGPGIPEETIGKIWDRFFTTDADRQGTGLGLAIVRSVARAHGGYATVRSTIGQGTTFTIHLPVYP